MDIMTESSIGNKALKEQLGGEGWQIIHDRKYHIKRFKPVIIIGKRFGTMDSFDHSGYIKHWVFLLKIQGQCFK